MKIVQVFPVCFELTWVVEKGGRFELWGFERCWWRPEGWAPKISRYFPCPAAKFVLFFPPHTHNTTQHTQHTQHTQTHTNTHQHTPTHTNTHQHTPTHTNTHQHTPTHTNTHKHTQTHNTHKHTQTQVEIGMAKTSLAKIGHDRQQCPSDLSPSRA